MKRYEFIRDRQVKRKKKKFTVEVISLYHPLFLKKIGSLGGWQFGSADHHYSKIT
jgi:hypothetical protein